MEVCKCSGINGNHDYKCEHYAAQAAATLEPDPVLEMLGKWGPFRHSNGVICCGSLRVARADFDTNPPADVQKEILDALCGITPSTPEPVAWKCFHCAESFTNVEDARLHFGATERVQPICQIDAAHVREMEAELSRYREEDTDLHRTIAALESAHYLALQREEEKGYARGLRDARNGTT